MTADLLTRPEGYVEKRDRRRVLALLVRDGGCAHCVHRDHLWGRAVCPRDAARMFPRCMNDQKTPAFELDETTIKGGER